MQILIAIIFAIILMAMLWFSGEAYINESSYIEKNFQIEVENQFAMLSQGYVAYRMYEKKTLPVASWDTEFRKYSFLPNKFKTFNWTFNNNAKGDYFCLTGNTTSNELYNSFNKAGLKFSNDSYFVNESCGETSNFTTTPDFNTNPKVSVTLYIR